MLRGEVLELSNEQAKKINSYLPKGYKLILPNEFVKKVVKNNRKNGGMEESMEKPVGRANMKQVKIEKGEASKQLRNLPSFKTFGDNLPQVNSNKSKVSKIFNKLKQHPSINLLSLVKLQNDQVNYAQICNKVDTLEDHYKVSDLVVDIQKLCLKIYESYSKNDTEYCDAADIENFLNTIVKKQIDMQKGQVPQLGPKISSSTNLGIKQNPKKKVVQKPQTYPTNSSTNFPPTLNQKRILGQTIKKLSSEYLQHICFILFETTENKQYSFDLDSIHVKKFREVQEYVKKVIEKTGDWQRNNEKSEDEFSNQSSFLIKDDDQE